MSYAYSNGKQRRYKKNRMKPGWIGRNANEKSLKRYCHEIWSELIKEKDNHTCFLCGSTDRLNSHHLITQKWAKTAFDIQNGITLCYKCHCDSIVSVGVSPWFLWEKLEKCRPEQYKYMIENRKLVCEGEQEKLDYKEMLNSLINEFEKTRPTTYSRSKYFIFSHEEELEIVQEYMSNLSIETKKIAEKHKCSENCINDIVRRSEISEEEREKMSYERNLLKQKAKIKKAEKEQNIDGKNGSENSYCYLQRLLQGIRVCEIDADGNILSEYISTTEAAQKNNIGVSSLNNCLKGLSKTCGGKRWIYKDSYKSGNLSLSLRQRQKGGPKKGNNPTSKKVDQFDQNGNHIKTWNSIREAKDCTGASQISYTCCLNQKEGSMKHKSRGFVWKYH